MPIVTFERRRAEEFAPTIEGAGTVNRFNDEPSARWRHMFRSTACARCNCLCTNGSREAIVSYARQKLGYVWFVW